MKSQKCPTCNGSGAIPACPTCGGSEVCPTCHGSGVISMWVPLSTGSTTDVGNMYNLRFQIDPGANTMWGLKPGANIIEVEMGVAEYKKSIINMKAVQPFEGI
jgi:DnaJ-class molecular chaperone